jgi:hypothetical protein
MTVYIPKAAVEMLAKLQDVTAILSRKPSQPERWIKLEIPEVSDEPKAAPQTKT